MAHGDFKRISLQKYSNGTIEADTSLKVGTYQWCKEVANRLRKYVELGTKEIVLNDTVVCVPLTEEDKNHILREAQAINNYSKRHNKTVKP